MADVALPARLKARGISAAAWRPLTNAQRRDIIKQSDAAAREAAGKGAPAGTPAAKERESRTRERAKRLADLPKDQTFDWWHKYGKRDEGPEFWELYREYAYG